MVNGSKLVLQTNTRNSLRANGRISGLFLSFPSRTLDISSMRSISPGSSLSISFIPEEHLLLLSERELRLLERREELFRRLESHLTEFRLVCASGMSSWLELAIFGSSGFSAGSFGTWTVAIGGLGALSGGGRTQGGMGPAFPCWAFTEAFEAGAS